MPDNGGGRDPRGEGPEPGGPIPAREALKDAAPEAPPPPPARRAAPRRPPEPAGFEPEPPLPTKEPVDPDELKREFEADGAEWVAWVAGQGAGGTGGWGLGYMVAVRFARTDRPDRPLRELLLARGRFEGLFDEELRDLLRRAVPLEPPEESGR